MASFVNGFVRSEQADLRRNMHRGGAFIRGMRTPLQMNRVRQELSADPENVSGPASLRTYRCQKISCSECPQREDCSATR